MKLSLLGLAAFFVLVTSGCSSAAIQEKIGQATQRLIQKDQNYEQGFDVNRAFIYDNFWSGDNYLKLSNKGLTSIPDLCSLLLVEDHGKVQFLTLANNKIRIVDQDLSCLSHLRVLNLSYNEITQVVSLGELPALQELLLHKNQLADASELPALPALKSLNLGYNKLKKVAGLEKFSALTKLELQHNEIAQIIGVENLNHLEELRLEFNKLKEVSFIDTLKNLRLVTTEGNKLAENVQKELKKLNELYRKVQGQTGSASGTGS